MKKLLFISLCLYITNALATPTATEIAACQARVLDNAKNVLCYAKDPDGATVPVCWWPYPAKTSFNNYVTTSQAYANCSSNKMTIYRYYIPGTSRKYMSLFPIPYDTTSDATFTTRYVLYDTYTFSVEDNAGTAGFQRLYLCAANRSLVTQTNWLEQFYNRASNSDASQCDGWPLTISFKWWNSNWWALEYYYYNWWSSNIVGHSFTPGTAGTYPVYSCKVGPNTPEYFISWQSNCEGNGAIQYGIIGYAKP